MGIADLLSAAGSRTPTTPMTSGGGIASLLSSAKSQPAPSAAAAQLPKLQMQGTQLAQTAQADNSFGGLVLGTAENVGENLFNFGKGYLGSLGQQYANVVPEVTSDVESGISDIQKGEEAMPTDQATKPVPPTAEQMQADGDSLNEIMNNLKENQSNVAGGLIDKGIVKAGGRTAGDVAGAIFAPISAAIGTALTQSGAQNLVDDGGNVIANTSGITDIPAFQKFALQHPLAGADSQRVMNLVLSGGGGDIDPVKMAEDSKAFAQKIVGNAPKGAPPAVVPPVEAAPAPTSAMQKLIVQAHGGETEVPIASKYTPDSELPTIEAGKGGSIDKSGLPTIQTEAPATNPRLGSLTYEPIPQEGENASTPPEIAPKQPVAATSEPNGTSIPTADNTPGIEPKMPSTAMPPETGTVTKAASDINARLVAQGIDKLPDSELAKFSPITKADQILRVGNLLDSNPEAARQMALGRIPIPPDIHPQVLYNAVIEAADKAGDFETSRALAKSPLATAQSELGQGLSATGFNKGEDTTVGSLKEVQAKMNEAAGKENVAGARQAAAKAGRAVLLPKEDLSWDNFIKKITC